MSFCLEGKLLCLISHVHFTLPSGIRGPRTSLPISLFVLEESQIRQSAFFRVVCSSLPLFEVERKKQAGLACLSISQRHSVREHVI